MKTIILRLSTLLCLIVFMHTPVQLSAQIGTGYEYMPSKVNVTGGGNMPDTTKGYICNCDGSGATDATSCLQAALNTASAQKKILLIPYTEGYYKIYGQLSVNCSVMGIGGMPTIKQTSREKFTSVFRCVNNMSGWIYNLHLVGTYNGSNGTIQNEWNHLINLGGVNGVTIKGNLLEIPEGDCVTDNAQENDVNQCRNVLITNNSMINPWRCGISTNNLMNNWAILNNYITYSSSYVDPIDLEPWREESYNQNIEIAYNDIQTPLPAWEDATHFYNGVVTLAGWFDSTPGGNIFIHHNYGVWGVPITKISGYKGAPSTWTNVVVTNNVEGSTPPATSDVTAPSVPSGLSALVSDSSFVLSWTASTDDVTVTKYEVFRSGISVGSTLTNSITIKNLSCANDYTMTVKARDAAINWSEASAPLIVTLNNCFGTDTIITFEDMPVIETALNGIYANINWGTNNWVTYNETNINPASKVLNMSSNSTSEQTDTLIILSGKVLKRLTIMALGNPSIKTITLSSTENPDCVFNDMNISNTTYQTNWKEIADTIIVKITCDAGASAIVLDNLVFGDAQAPSAPTSLESSSIKYTSAILSWAASSDNYAVVGYEVFMNNVSIGITSDTSLNITGLTCNTEYLFTVKAKDIVENWSVSSLPFAIKTSECDINPPSVPDGFSAINVTASSFVLSWNSSTDNDKISGYEVYKDGIKYGSTISDISMLIMGLLQNTPYSMSVNAIDASGNKSDRSSEFIVTTKQCTLPQDWTGVNIGVTSDQESCESSGIFTIVGAGADIWETADQFRYVYKSMTGNCGIIAKVESIENTLAWAKSGVMIRESIDPSSKQVDCIITPTNGVSFQNRPTTGGISTLLGSLSGVSAPYWVKLERIGNSFSAYSSADGNTWAQMSTAKPVTMSANVLVGLAVTSHVAGVSCTSVISNVSTYIIPNVGITSEQVSEISIFPNPATANITIANIPHNSAISVFTTYGVKMETIYSHSNNSIDLDISSWSKGVYLFKTQTNDKVTIRKVVIE